MDGEGGGLSTAVSGTCGRGWLALETGLGGAGAGADAGADASTKLTADGFLGKMSAVDTGSGASSISFARV